MEAPIGYDPAADQRRDQSEGAAAARVCARKLDDDALAGGASVRVRNGVLVNAATVTRDGRWVHAIEEPTCGLTAAAAGRTTARPPITAKTSPAINAFR